MQYNFFTQLTIGLYIIIFNWAVAWKNNSRIQYTLQSIPLEHQEGNVCNIDFYLWIQTELSLHLDSISY